jgi:hypothetical protein
MNSEFLTDILININFLAYSNYEYENNEILIKIKSIRKGIIFNIKVEALLDNQGKLLLDKDNSNRINKIIRSLK